MRRFTWRLFKITICLIFICLALTGSLLASDQKKRQPRGVWVSCFSERRVLYSKEAVSELVDFCKETGINEIYLQLYRAGQAYYDSQIADRSKYEELLSVAGMDTIDFLLNEANKSGIKTFAWINVLSLAQNKQAHILAKFGASVLTRDQYLRPSGRDEDPDESDRYYLRDSQLFLEPGDSRVVDYMLSIVNEVLQRYPAIAGVHLDYIRYPYAVPYSPGSRFIPYGLAYGYGQENLTRFRQETGLDPLNMRGNADNFLTWDNWRRQQVTALVERVSGLIKNKSRRFLVSCAVLAQPGQAYSIAFQDWPLWLERGIVDYVVLMNYTPDNRLFKETTSSALSHRGKGQVYVGIGAFLMKDRQEALLEQYRIISDLDPDGIVFFSYDDISDKKEMISITLSR
jgi:uncharacterized lipoprotein YddW (UPF0748 family)